MDTKLTSTFRKIENRFKIYKLLINHEQLGYQPY